MWSLKMENKSNLSDPIEILIAEHDEALFYLEELNKAILKAEATGFDKETLNKITTSINFIDSDIKAHNQKEELYLFPLLAKHVTGPIAVMEHEHKTLWDALARLKELMAEVNELEQNKGSIITKCRFIIYLLSNHIQKENQVLFPMAKHNLTEEEYLNFKNGILDSKK